MKVGIKLDQDDVNLLGQYLCQDWTINQGNSENIFESAFWDIIDKYLNNKPIKWSKTPSMEAELLMDYITEVYNRIDYRYIDIKFYWENDND